MCIPLSNYKPFDHVKNLTEFGFDQLNRPTQDVLHLCKKVAQVALAILLFIPVLAADLVITPAAYIYRWIFPVNDIPAPRPIQRPLQPPVEPPAGKIPSDVLIDQVMENPYIIRPWELNDQQFFRDGMRNAFRFLGEQKAAQYKELIESAGAEDNPPVNIFQWSASCLLVQYLRTLRQGIYMEQRFPHICPDQQERLQGHAEEERIERNRVHRDRIDHLRATYTDLNRFEKATGLLQLLVPEERWALNRRTAAFVQQTLALSHEITQNQYFNRQIYLPIAQDVDNI